MSQSLSEDARSDAPRVAHVLRKFDPAEWGGTETHVTAVCNRLSDHGWAPEVHAPVGPPDIDLPLAATIPIRRFNYSVPFLGSTQKRHGLVGNAGNIVSLHEFARLARDTNLDLAHVHTLRRLGGAVRSAMRWTARPYIVSIHGPLFTAKDFLQRDTRLRYSGTLDIGAPIGLLLGARRVIDDAARVISFNNEEHQQLVDRIGRRAVRMDHGVEVGRLENGSIARGRARWPQLGESPIVVLLGRIAAQKNHALALRAFAGGAPPNHLLVFAGAQTDLGLRAHLEQMARELGILERVVFLGNIKPLQEVPDLLAMARVVLVPSLHEAFGLAVLEAWAASRPVIFSQTSGIADLGVGRDDCLGVDDPQSWRALLAELLTNKDRRKELATTGRSIVEQRFDWHVVAGKLAQLYREVVAENAAALHARNPWLLRKRVIQQ